MLTLGIVIAKLCIPCLRCMFQQALNSLFKDDPKSHLQLAQLFNLPSKSRDKQNEILKELYINYSYCGFPKKLQPYEGYTCLHIAVEKRDLELTNKLISLGASLIRQELMYFFTPLHIALNTALSVKNRIYNVVGKQPESAFVNTLLSTQVKYRISANPKCNYGFSHLHIACIVNHVEAVKFFIENGSSVNQSVSSKDSFNKYTTLHFAVRYSAVETTEILLNHGADIHWLNSEGISPLHLLIERLMDVNEFLRIGKRTLVIPYENELKRLQTIAELFLKNKKLKVNINYISNVAWKIVKNSYLYFVDDTGVSPLHLACFLPDITQAEFLLDQYGYINLPVTSNSKRWPGWTPLHFAACCNPEVVKLLIERKADLSIKNAKGETPLELFLQRFNPDIVCSMLSMKDELSSIKLSDNDTTLLDLLLVSSNIVEFETFLHYLPDVNISIPLESPFWPGNTIMHLIIMMNEKTKPWEEFKKKTDFQENLDLVPGRYNCTEEEENIYSRRIELCLTKGCNFTIKNVDGQTPLHLAFRMHKAQLVEKFLENCHTNETDFHGLSHFHIACVIGKIDFIKKFIDNGANVNSPVKNSFQWLVNSGKSELLTIKANSTPLHIAVTFQHTEVVSLLLEKGSDVYAKDLINSTPIHLSIKLNLRSIAQLLLEKTPNLEESLDKDETSHLQVAVYADNEAAVTNLLSKSSLSPRDKRTLQVLAWNSLSTNAYRVLVKISNGDELIYDLIGISQPIALPIARKVKRENWRDPKIPLDSNRNMTLLHFACAKFDIKWAKRLLRKGADVNARIQRGFLVLPGDTPLYILINEAARYAVNAPPNLINLVNLLIKRGADVTILCQGQTPVHRLSYILSNRADPQNHNQAFLLPVVDLMLQNQKDYKINPIDDQRFTHFHYACARNLVKVVKKFLDHGVNVNQVTYAFATVNAGFTPLHFATAYRWKEVTELLLERGADIHARDAFGNTPFHWAVKLGLVNMPLVEYLLKNGVEVNATNALNETPLACLLKLNNYTLEQVNLFLEHECSIKFVNNDLREKGILGLVLIRALPRDRQTIIKRIIEHLHALKIAVENGFNAILSLVKAPVDRHCTANDYLEVIEQLIDLGCDIDQKNDDGITPLHGAVFHVNVEAIQALLQLGVDLKLVTQTRPIFPNFPNAADMPRFNEIVTLLAVHVWKMKLVGFDENEWSPVFDKQVMGNYLIDNNVEDSCQRELVKMEDTKISRDLNVKSFLSELKGAAEYPLLLLHRRILIDNFFKKGRELRDEFPQLCGLLSYRYKHVLARMKLWNLAKEAFVSIDPYYLPDICVEMILKYMRNDELQIFIRTEKEFLDSHENV